MVKGLKHWYRKYIKPHKQAIFTGIMMIVALAAVWKGVRDTKILWEQDMINRPHVYRPNTVVDLETGDYIDITTGEVVDIIPSESDKQLESGEARVKLNVQHKHDSSKHPSAPSRTIDNVVNNNGPKWKDRIVVIETPSLDVRGFALSNTDILITHHEAVTIRGSII